MQTIIYIYTRTGTTPILQIFDALELSISEKISDISTATFKIPLYTSEWKIHEALTNISYLHKKNKIKIAFLDKNGEKEVFSGVISGITDTEIHTEVRCSDDVLELSERIIHEDENHPWRSIENIIRGVFGRISAVSPLWFFLDENFPTEVVHKKFSAGNNFLAILKDLAGEKYVFSIKNKQLFFGENIGEDLSTGENFVEFRSDFRETFGRNISSFTFFSDVKNIKNAVFGKNSAGVKFYDKNDASIAEFGRIEGTVTKENNLSVEASVKRYLEMNKDDKIEMTIVPKLDDYTAVKIGDMVKIYIDRWDARGKFDGNMQITGKNFTNGVTTLTLSSGKIRTPNILEKINELSEELRRLQSL